MIYNIVIVGGGSSGLICAINAKNDNNKILILEKNNELGKKIKITGNGRCNYYNEYQDINCYNSSNSDILNDVFKQITDLKINDYFDSLGITPLIKDGYYYPYSNKAITIRDTLNNEIINKGIEVKYDYIVSNINKTNDFFIINNEIKTKYVVLATGGITYPITGSTGDGYNILKDLNHEIIPLKPVLGKLYVDDPLFKKLKGIRAHAKVSINNKSDEGELQINEDSISGICVFNISRFADVNDTIYINFIPFTKDPYNYINTRINNLNTSISDVLSRILNKTLVDVILNKAKINSSIDKLNESELNTLIDLLTNYKVNVIGLSKLEEAQVTAGGLNLKDINIDNYESKIIPNLFVIGELLDLDGICGGYNLSIAWNSGIRAGKYLSNK